MAAKIAGAVIAIIALSGGAYYYRLTTKDDDEYSILSITPSVIEPDEPEIDEVVSPEPSPPSPKKSKGPSKKSESSCMRIQCQCSKGRKIKKPSQTLTYKKKKYCPPEYAPKNTAIKTLKNSPRQSPKLSSNTVFKNTSPLPKLSSNNDIKNNSDIDEYISVAYITMRCEGCQKISMVKQDLTELFDDHQSNFENTDTEPNNNRDDISRSSTNTQELEEKFNHQWNELLMEKCRNCCNKKKFK